MELKVEVKDPIEVDYLRRDVFAAVFFEDDARTVRLYLSNIIDEGASVNSTDA